MDSRTLAKGIFVGGFSLFIAVMLLQTVLRLFDVVVVIFLGLMLSQAIEPAIAYMEMHRVPRAAGVLAIYLAVLLLVVGVGLVTIPPIARDIGSFVVRLPDLSDQALSNLAPLNDFLARFGVKGDPRAGIRQLLEQAGGNLIAVLTVPLLIFQVLVSFFTVFVFAFLFSVTGHRLQRLLVAMTFPDKREPAMVVAQHVGLRIGGFVRSELLVMTSVGILSWLGLLLVGAPFAHLFGLVAFFTEAIPMVGPILGAIPPLIVSLFISPWLTLQVAVIYFIVQNVENNLLAPLIHGNQLSISPLLIITAILVGSGLYGIVGAFIAVPVAAALQVLFEDVVVPWREAQIVKQMAEKEAAQAAAAAAAKQNANPPREEPL